MKTAISIPDELFKKAEKLGKKKKVSRSQLYAEALREYVARSPGEWVTEQINRALCNSRG